MSPRGTGKVFTGEAFSDITSSCLEQPLKPPACNMQQPTLSSDPGHAALFLFCAQAVRKLYQLRQMIISNPVPERR